MNSLDKKSQQTIKKTQGLLNRIQERKKQEKIDKKQKQESLNHNNDFKKHLQQCQVSKIFPLQNQYFQQNSEKQQKIFENTFLKEQIKRINVQFKKLQQKYLLRENQINFLIIECKKMKKNEQLKPILLGQKRQFKIQQIERKKENNNETIIQKQIKDQQQNQKFQSNDELQTISSTKKNLPKICQHSVASQTNGIFTKQKQHNSQIILNPNEKSQPYETLILQKNMFVSQGMQHIIETQNSQCQYESTPEIKKQSIDLQTQTIQTEIQIKSNENQYNFITKIKKQFATLQTQTVKSLVLLKQFQSQTINDACEKQCQQQFTLSIKQNVFFYQIQPLFKLNRQQCQLKTINQIKNQEYESKKQKCEIIQLDYFSLTFYQNDIIVEKCAQLKLNSQVYKQTIDTTIFCLSQDPNSIKCKIINQSSTSQTDKTIDKISEQFSINFQLQIQKKQFYAQTFKKIYLLSQYKNIHLKVYQQCMQSQLNLQKQSKNQHIQVEVQTTFCKINPHQYCCHINQNEQYLLDCKKLSVCCNSFFHFIQVQQLIQSNNFTEQQQQKIMDNQCQLKVKANTTACQQQQKNITNISQKQIFFIQELTDQLKIAYEKINLLSQEIENLRTKINDKKDKGINKIGSYFGF